jgi:hypothetical protein
MGIYGKMGKDKKNKKKQKLSSDKMVLLPIHVI